MIPGGRPLRRTAERGAAATLVAVFAATGVLLGMLAISVDVGNVMLERRQLQNAADSTAMALAQICAGSAEACTGEEEGPTLTELDALSNANTRSDDSLLRVCGARLPAGADLPDCTTVPADVAISTLSMCPPLPDWLAGGSTPYVETYTQTTGLESFFITRDRDTEITSCARAAWGKAAFQDGLFPLVISVCEWERNTGEGVTYADPPQYQTGSPGGSGDPGYGTHNPWPSQANPSKEVVISIRSGTDIICDSPPSGPSSGTKYPGGFGFVKGCGSPTSQGWVEGASGHGCAKELAGIEGTVVNIPVYDCVAQNNKPKPQPPFSGTTCVVKNNNSSFHIVGFAKFYVSGYLYPQVGSGQGKRVAPGNHPSPCHPSKECITGWFLRGTLDTEIAPPGEGHDFGVVAIRPAG